MSQIRCRAGASHQGAQDELCSGRVELAAPMMYPRGIDIRFTAGCRCLGRGSQRGTWEQPQSQSGMEVTGGMVGQEYGSRRKKVRNEKVEKKDFESQTEKDIYKKNNNNAIRPKEWG